MSKLIKLTNPSNQTFLIGVNAIIKVESVSSEKSTAKSIVYVNGDNHHYCVETLDDIYNEVNGYSAKKGAQM